MHTIKNDWKKYCNWGATSAAVIPATKTRMQTLVWPKKKPPTGMQAAPMGYFRGQIAERIDYVHDEMAYCIAAGEFASN